MEKIKNWMKNKIIFLVIGIVLIGISSFVYADIIWSEEVGVDFEVTSSNPVCIRDTTTSVWRWWNSTTQEVEETNSQTIGECFRENGWPSRGCCPEGDGQCDLTPTSSTYGSCAGSPPNWCSDYNAERYGTDAIAKNHCLAFDPDVAEKNMKEITQIENICSGNYKKEVLQGGETCWVVVFDCRCVWDDTENICKPQASESDPICPSTPQITRAGNCSFEETGKIDDCENSGYISYTWRALWENGASERPDWCKDATRRFRCAIKLFFFTITTFIITIIVIIIIYLIWFRKKKGKQKEKVKLKKRTKS